MTRFHSIARVHRLHTTAKKYIPLFGLLLISCSPGVITNDQKPTLRSGPGPQLSYKLKTAIELFRGYYVDTFIYDPERDTSIWAICGRLDPYTGYMSKPTLDRFNSDIFGGTLIKYGFGMEEDGDSLICSYVNPFSICRQQGLCIGDRIVAYDGIRISPANRRVIDSVLFSDRLAPVTLTIVRNGEHRSITITKCTLPANDVFEAVILSDSVVYVTFNSFFEGVASRLETTISGIRTVYPQIHNVIIDLRWNTGGLVNEAVELANEFCQYHRPIMYEVSAAHPKKGMEIYARNIPVFGSFGVVVLVNEDSYSASELLAGTLQDLDRATVIGQQTGGKGLVMQIKDLDEGDAIYMTTFRYALPSGRCIQVPYVDGIQMERHPEPDTIVYNWSHRYERQFQCERRPFFTIGDHREVYGQMGIIPDILMPDYSNNYAFEDLTYKQGHSIWRAFVDHVQPLIIASTNYPAFIKRLPMNKTSAFVTQTMKKLGGKQLLPDRSMALLQRMLYWVQQQYYGIGTASKETLACDPSIIMAERVLNSELSSSAQQTALANK